MSHHNWYARSPVAPWVVALFFCAVFPQGAMSDDFHGYPCTEDCSGHEAGYNWADRNDIHDSGECSGNSQSFVEGCQAYTEENPSEHSSSDDADENDDPDTHADPEPREE